MGSRQRSSDDYGRGLERDTESPALTQFILLPSHKMSSFALSQVPSMASHQNKGTGTSQSMNPDQSLPFTDGSSSEQAAGVLASLESKDKVAFQHGTWKLHTALLLLHCLKAILNYGQDIC